MELRFNFPIMDVLMKQVISQVWLHGHIKFRIFVFLNYHIIIRFFLTQDRRKLNILLLVSHKQASLKKYTQVFILIHITNISLILNHWI